MKLLSETLTELGIAFSFPIVIEDANGRVTYNEDEIFSERWERDANGNITYYENSNGYWSRSERDAIGNRTYFENSDGFRRGTPRSAKTWEGKVIEVDGIKYKLTALHTL